MSEEIESTEACGEQSANFEDYKTRAAIYGLLARLFRVEVDAGYLEELSSYKFPARVDDGDVDKGIRLIVSYLSTTWENSVTDLAVDFTRIFIGHGMSTTSAAFPYESVYTSEGRLMMESARSEVLALYRSEGVKKRDEWREDEDHIAFELEFMQVEGTKTLEALERGDEDEARRLLTVQRSFIEHHLENWVGMFARDIRKFAKTDFYVGASHLLEGFLAIDRKFVDAALASSDLQA